MLPFPVAAVTGDGAPAFVTSPYGVEVFDGTIDAGGTTITYAYPGGPVGLFRRVPRRDGSDAGFGD